MLDPKLITEMVEQKISTTIDEQVMEVFSTDEWLQPIEQKIVKYTQDHILRKFANAAAMPEIIDAVKKGVIELFVDGQIPDLDKFVNPETIRHSVDIAVRNAVQANVSTLARDPEWLVRVEELINQAVARQALTTIGNIDINSMVNDRVDERLEFFREQLRQDFASTGISDLATDCRLTVMDDNTVVDNTLLAKDLEIADSAVINHLVVKGSINTDNYAWKALADDITDKTLTDFTKKFQDQLVREVAKHIKTDGIDFDQILFGGDVLVEGNRLSNAVTESNIQKLGALRSLKVTGDSLFADTVSIKQNRMGVNTEEPEMAVSVWDEEVAINIGKNKLNQAYIGTSRAQGIVFGTNRVGQLEITADGLTQIKKLQVGLHKIGHATEVPGWSGTRGDMMLNSNPGNDRVFAWVCLGAYKWQPLKVSAE